MIPVFVPSYKRPKATFLVRSFKYKFPLYVFVRKEDSGYDYLKQRPDTHLIKLASVRDLGETREAMVRYAHKKGFTKIFMLDDDITRLDLTLYDKSRGCCVASGTVKGEPEDWAVVLAAWEDLWDEEALFGALYRPFSWSIKREFIAIPRKAQLQQCVGVNVKSLYQAGLNYRSNAEIGNEDLYLQYECYKAGLDAVQIPAIQYDCPAMGHGKGGCCDGVGLIEKQARRIEAFLSACNNDPMVRVAVTKSGVPSIKFNWRAIR